MRVQKTSVIFGGREDRLPISVLGNQLQRSRPSGLTDGFVNKNSLVPRFNGSIITLAEQRSFNNTVRSPMSSQQHQTTTNDQATPDVRPSAFSRCVEDPMRSVIAASLGTMSTLGIVLCGIWAINAALP